ncbi:MAG: STAS domain-containing protein [Gammaproteobacteria bacterium]|nr:STAS domain-containing protein [Gammaproteobacteria bacterium]
MGNAIVGKSDDKSQVLGDDPLAWLNAGGDSAKKTAEKKVSNKKKKVKKAASKKAKPKNDTKPKEPKVEAVSSSNRLELESSLVINKASDIFESLKQLDTTGSAIEIDASKVEIIDSAILQLLFSFVLSLKEKGVKLVWHKPTESLLNKASILGLTDQLGL